MGRMRFRILLIGPFDPLWEKSLQAFGTVDTVGFEEALAALEVVEYSLIVAKGGRRELDSLSDSGRSILTIEDSLSGDLGFLHSILDNLPHMVFVKDAKDLSFVAWNRAGEEIVGVRRENMLGKTDYDLFPAEEAAEFQRKDREVLNQRQLHDIPEERLLSRSGPRLLHTKKIPICDSRGEPIYLLGISEDITELNEIKAAAATRLEAAREAERRHIARELHDELGQLLTALKLDLGRLQSNLTPELVRQTEPMSELLNHTIKTVRRLATELRPQILDDLGLRAGLEWLIQQACQRTGLRHELHWGLAEQDLNDDARSALFRICQEALNNVIRHADATKVTIQMLTEKRQLRLRVVDDGLGFSVSESHRFGLGLLGIQERINLLGGTLAIDSKPGVGTRLVASAPLDRCLRVRVDKAGRSR